MRGRLANALRVLLSSYVTTGVSAGLWLMLISGTAYLLLGQYAAILDGGGSHCLCAVRSLSIAEFSTNE